MARQRMGKRGQVVAIDLLPMDPLDGVGFFQGDFHDQVMREKLKEALGGEADLVLSDLAPNISGLALYDQARAAELWDAALGFSVNLLQRDGKFLVKVFHGGDFESYVKRMRGIFETVATRKPAASRGRSSEVYLLGKTLRPGAVERWSAEEGRVD